MATKVIEFDCQCESCHGTGIYAGFAEGRGVGVVCHQCEGKGWQHKVIEYTETDKKRKRNLKVRHVWQANPGIGLAVDNDCCGGGMPYKNWFAGEPFPEKAEPRHAVCPCWWYQSADYDKKPDWEDCLSTCGKSFSQCDYFSQKHKCWERFDQENSRSKKGKAR